MMLCMYPHSKFKRIKYLAKSPRSLTRLVFPLNFHCLEYVDLGAEEIEVRLNSISFFSKLECVELGNVFVRLRAERKV